MCLICVDWQKGKLTNSEAWLNMSEMVDSAVENNEDASHYLDLATQIAEKIVEESEL